MSCSWRRVPWLIRVNIISKIKSYIITIYILTLSRRRVRSFSSSSTGSSFYYSFSSNAIYLRFLWKPSSIRFLRLCWARPFLNMISIHCGCRLNRSSSSKRTHSLFLSRIRLLIRLESKYVRLVPSWWIITKSWFVMIGPNL